MTINTPWGQADSMNTVAPGITLYTTPSHGGYHLSADRRAEMPAELAAIPTFCGKSGWYEEDADWAIVALSFPEHFTPHAVRNAIRTAEECRFWKPSLACRNWLNLNNESERAHKRAKETA